MLLDEVVDVFVVVVLAGGFVTTGVVVVTGGVTTEEPVPFDLVPGMLDSTVPDLNTE